MIAWSVAGLFVAGVALAVIFGSVERRVAVSSLPPIHLFSSEMTSEQFEEIHKGESETAVLTRLRSVGLQEDQLESSELPSLFPPQPRHSTCSYWTLSDAPGHLVRLCFSDPEGVLLQKAVAVSGGSQPPKTLV